MDGHALVYRAWYAIQTPLIAPSSGQDVRGVYGFINAFIKSINEWQPSHCAIAFDLPTPTFRHTQYPEYKAQRPESSDDLRAQFPWVKQLMEVLKIPVFELEGYEADDILGSLSDQATKQNMQTVILTGDTDTLQLVSPMTRVVLSRGIQDRTIYDEEAVEDRYGGLKPIQQPDIKGLQGDPSDNIPGVPGIGAKTAIKLIQQFGSIDNIYKNIEKVQPQRIKDLLISNEPQARQGKELTTILRDIPIILNLETSKFWNYNREEVLDFIRNLGFSSVISRIPESRNVDYTESQGLLMEPESAPSGVYKTVDEIEDLELVISGIKNSGQFAFDVETDSKDQKSANLVGIAVASKVGEGYYIPLGHQQGKQIPMNYALEKLKGLFEDPHIEKCAHNGNFDLTVLSHYGIVVNNFTFDTIIAAHLLGERSLGLKNLAFKLLNIEMTPIEKIIGTGRKQTTMDNIDITTVTNYACADVDMTLRLNQQFLEKIQLQKDVWNVFNNMEVPLIPVLLRMQDNGILINGDFLYNMSLDLEKRLNAIQKDLFGVIGHEFMLSSTKQLSDLLYTELKLPRLKRTKTGYSTDAAVLDNLKQMIMHGQAVDSDPRSAYMIDGILEYRELAKLKSTYVDALPQLIDNGTSRIHTKYNQTGSATGRVSSSDPNLQNIPVRTELGKKVRTAFIPQMDWTFIAADYSQIELRVLAHLSKDPALINAFLNHQDIHASTASQVYKTDIESVDPEMRRIAKIMNFGVIYGLSPYGISQQTNLSSAQGAEFIKQYFSEYPGIYDYLEETKIKARELGYVETLAGRRRYIPEINSPNFQVRQGAERVAVNMPIQGTAADIIKLAMISIDRKLIDAKLRSKMLLQVHDELIFEVPTDEMDIIKSIILELMPGAMRIDVPLDVQIKTGSNWGELE